MIPQNFLPPLSVLLINTVSLHSLFIEVDWPYRQQVSRWTVDFNPVFFFQELDGSSLLLMQRSDVINGLGLKLGPALKVYNKIQKFQLRQLEAKN